MDRKQRTKWLYTNNRGNEMFKKGDLVRHKSTKKIYIVLEEIGGGKLRAQHYSLEWKKAVSRTLTLWNDNVTLFEKGDEK